MNYLSFNMDFIHSYLCFLCNAFIFVYFGCYRSLSYELFKLCTIPAKSSKVIQIMQFTQIM